MRSRSGDAFPMAVQFGHVEELIHTWGTKGLFEEREFKFVTRQHPVVPKKKKPGRRAGDAERAIVASIVKGKTRDMRVDRRQAYCLW